MMSSSSKATPDAIKRVRYKQQPAASATSKSRRYHSGGAGSSSGGSSGASSVRRKKLSASAPVCGQTGSKSVSHSHLAKNPASPFSDFTTPEDQEEEEEEEDSSISLFANSSSISSRRLKLGSTSSYLSLGGASITDADEMDGVGGERQQRGDSGPARQFESVQQREQEAAKAEKLMLIKRLLANFSLEQTYDHYRNLYSRSLVINPAAFSFDCAMPATRARDRLQRMTGSDSVQLNDSNYMTMLSKKYWEEYEEELDKAEKQRMEAEKNRVRRLMVQGYITPDELHDVEQEAAKRQAAKKKTKQPAPHPDQSTDTRRGSNGSHQKNTTSKTVSMRVSEDDQTSTSQSTHSHDADDADEQQPQGELQHNGTSNGHNGAHHDDKDGGDGGRHDNQSPHPKSATPTLAPPPPVKYTPKYIEPRLVQLYNQESVDSLYGMAEQLVPPRNKYQSDSKTSSRKVVIQ